MKKLNDTVLRNVLKVCSGVLALYLAWVVGVFFIMGDVLRYESEQSAGATAQPTNSTVELYGENYVDQYFTLTTDFDRVTSASIMWSAFSRVNHGLATVSLYRVTDGGEEFLTSGAVDVSQIGESYTTGIVFDRPADVAPGDKLKFRLSADSAAGDGASPLINEDDIPADSRLVINGEERSGVLCFSLGGQRKCVFGEYYWYICALGALAIILVSLVVYLKLSRGKKSVIASAFTALKRYRFLIQQLVSRDFKAKYKRSWLGVVWSFINPLLTTFVMYIVFSNIFRFNVDHYAVYLISGVVLFNFFTECCGLCLGSIVGNAALITKVYIPKYIYPLTRTLSSSINLAIALIPALIIALLNGIFPTWSWILAIYPIVCLILFCYGLGMLLSTLMVFFRDIQFIWNVLSMIWMYMTPLFYPVDILSDELRVLLQFNPLYYYVTFFRTCILEGASPEPLMYFQCIGFSLVMLLVGSLVFKKNQDKFVLYL